MTRFSPRIRRAAGRPLAARPENREHGVVVGKHRHARRGCHGPTLVGSVWSHRAESRGLPPSALGRWCVGGEGQLGWGEGQ